ncbi:Hpt domain-containing response regulator [Dyella flagellata]|uniref:Response regulator receiver domain-containing protein n=1 Tax=Dyella flagellata TaxID=1867833 RepID=A0ABQ5XI92_9GAMM|nr:response regulator [Dyella flagellata]GLQ90253.1 hypothetical protein GCM10007898_38280 [Dyella flagellata]
MMNTYSQHTTSTTPMAVRDAAASYEVLIPAEAPARVLLLEADPESRRVIVDQIAALEQEPLVVPDGSAALDAIHHQAPAMILMACVGAPDPESGEVELCSMMRKLRTGLPYFPIIILAAETNALLWQYCIGDNGIDGVLQKPLRVEKLETLLRLWLDLPSPARDEPVQSLPRAPNSGLWYQACLKEDIRGFERAWADGDMPSMVRCAYRLHGVAQLLGAQRATKLADRLEQAARGNKPLEADAMRNTLAALKKAIARYLE